MRIPKISELGTNPRATLEEAALINGFVYYSVIEDLAVAAGQTLGYGIQVAAGYSVIVFAGEIEVIGGVNFTSGRELVYSGVTFQAGGVPAVIGRKNGAGPLPPAGIQVIKNPPITGLTLVKEKNFTVGSGLITQGWVVTGGSATLLNLRNDSNQPAEMTIDINFVILPEEGS